MGEAKVAASSVWSDGFGAAEMGGDDDDRERWALERLSEGILKRGGLVPVSSKYVCRTSHGFCSSDRL